MIDRHSQCDWSIFDGPRLCGITMVTNYKLAGCCIVTTGISWCGDIILCLI